MPEPITAHARANVHASSMHLLRTILRELPATKATKEAAAHVLQARHLVLKEMDRIDEMDRLLNEHVRGIRRQMQKPTG